MNCGLVSVSFRGHSPERIIEEAKNAGLSCIEWGSDVHAPCKDIENLKKIAKIQTAAGLYCSSYGTYFRIGTDNTDELTDYINAAKILGTDILRVWCGNKGYEEYSNDDAEFIISECIKAASIAEKNNAVICLECHNNTFTDTKAAAIRLMKEVNSPAFRMYWQPNQFISEEENLLYARLLAVFTKNIHVFNWKGDNRYSLFEGKEIWQKYLSLFSDDKTLLLEFMPDDNIQSLKKEAEALREIIMQR